MIRGPTLASAKTRARTSELVRRTALYTESIRKYTCQMSLYMSVLFIAGFLGGLLSARSLPKAATIDLGYNRYQGVTLRNGVEQYLRMRYAKAPVHDLRFRAPEDPEKNSKLLDASSVSVPASINGEQALTSLVRAHLCWHRADS